MKYSEVWSTFNEFMSVCMYVCMYVCFQTENNIATLPHTFHKNGWNKISL